MLLEKALQERFPGYSAVATSRASTALYLALKSVADEKGYGDVLIPSTVCPSVPLTAALAGFRPRFCDVDLETFCLSPETISAQLSERAKAVVIVHLFGKASDVTSILDIASRESLTVIEDIAQAIGGDREGRPLGSFGDFSVLSFDDTKIVGGGGGALLARDGRSVENILRHHRTLEPAGDAHSLLELKRGFRDFTMGLYDLLRSDGLREPADLLPRTLEKFRRLFVHRRDLSESERESVLRNLSSLPAERKMRFKHYSEYDRRLRPDIRRVSFTSSDMCWRLPLLANTHQEQLRIIDGIRSKGGLASNHYFPASYGFGEAGCENARQIGLRAVNLWVDSQADEENIDLCCRVINEGVA